MTSRLCLRWRHLRGQPLLQRRQPRDHLTVELGFQLLDPLRVGLNVAAERSADPAHALVDPGQGRLPAIRRINLLARPAARARATMSECDLLILPRLEALQPRVELVRDTHGALDRSRLVAHQLQNSGPVVVLRAEAAERRPSLLLLRPLERFGESRRLDAPPRLFPARRAAALPVGRAWAGGASAASVVPRCLRRRGTAAAPHERCARM